MNIKPITSFGHISSTKNMTAPSTVFEDFMPKTFFKHPSQQVKTEDDQQKRIKELQLQLQECILLYNLTKDPKILRQIENIQQRLDKLMTTTSTGNNSENTQQATIESSIKTTFE